MLCKVKKEQHGKEKVTKKDEVKEGRNEGKKDSWKDSIGCYVRWRRSSMGKRRWLEG